MTTSNLSFFQLPNVSEYRCIDGVIKKICEFNKDCSLDSKINQLALIVLAEVAAIFDLCTEFVIFCVDLTKDLLTLTFTETHRIKKLFFSTLKIGYFFLGLIPFIIESQLDFKKLGACINLENTSELPTQNEIANSQAQEIQSLKAALEEKEEELSMRPDLSSNVFALLENYENLMDPDTTYFEKFDCEPDQLDELLRKMDLLIFWTTTKNHTYLLPHPLTPSATERCLQLNSFYRTLVTIHRAFGKLYSFDSINLINQLFKGELNDIEKMIGYDDYSKNVHKKIFWTFKKLFMIYLFMKDIEQKPVTTDSDPDSLEILRAIFINTYALFDDHLRTYHPDLTVHVAKSISIKRSLIEEHFSSHRSVDDTLSILLEACSILENYNTPYAKLANSCMQKSLLKCRNVSI